jgi:hypothetical protein
LHVEGAKGSANRSRVCELGRTAFSNDHSDGPALENDMLEIDQRGFHEQLIAQRFGAEKGWDVVHATSDGLGHIPESLCAVHLG